MRLWLAALALLAASPQDGTFESYDVMIDTGGRPLAAFQFEVTGGGKIVGIDQGELSEDPPYYDPAALADGRVTVAHYTLSEAPPSGRVRVATLRFYVLKEEKPEATLSIAAAPGGERMDARITLVHRGENP